MAMDFIWRDGERVMFIGDSVTEDPLGYIRIIPSLVTARYPDRGIEYMPRGVGGNRIGDLVERLNGDILGNGLMPTWVSVSVGINDVQHGATGTPIGRFQDLYHELMQRLRDATGATLACLTTTVIGEELENEQNTALAPYNEAIRVIAYQYGADVIDLNLAFHEYIRRAQAHNPDFRYTIDGTRLNTYGNYLAAMTILEKLHFSPVAQF